MENPYISAITVLMDMNTFNNLTDERPWCRVIRVCKALAQMSIPGDTKTTVADWMEHRLAVSTAEGRGIELRAAQAEVLNIIEHIFWPCGCADRLAKRTCKGHAIAKKYLSDSAAEIPQPPPAMRKRQRVYRQVGPGPGAKPDPLPPSHSAAAVSDVRQLKTVDSLTLVPGRSGSKTTANYLRIACEEANKDLEHPWVREQMVKDFRRHWIGYGNYKIFVVWYDVEKEMNPKMGPVEVKIGELDRKMRARKRKASEMEESKTTMDEGLPTQNDAEEGVWGVDKVGLEDDVSDADLCQLAERVKR